MENASKALIMAGGTLIAILIVTLLIYAWSIFSEYQSSRDSLAEIEDTAKFNLQFTNYDRDNVLGYELLSLLNKIVDYNERKTERTLNGNDDRYPYIQIKIYIGNEEVRKKHFTYNGEIQLFKNSEYTDNELTITKYVDNKRTSFKGSIEDQITNIGAELGSIREDTLTSMAKNIKSIFKTQKEIDDESRLGRATADDIKKIMVNKFNSYMNNDYKINYETVDSLILDENRNTSKNIKTVSGNIIQNLYGKLCAYYEYMQFKKGIFKCTDIKYDVGEEKTGRVTSISFEFTEKIK